MTRAALVSLALVTACSSVELAAPTIRARTGPAAGRPLRRVVALPSTCGSLSSVRVETADPEHPEWRVRPQCPDQAMTAIDNQIRASLEFGGFEIIDSERVNAVTASRREILERTRFSTVKTTEQQGARFDDATPFEQRQILDELRADGVLNVRVAIGAGVGFGQRRTVTVQARLLAIADGALVWARRCELEVGGLTSDEIAMERGARCAVEGARAR